MYKVIGATQIPYLWLDSKPLITMSSMPCKVTIAISILAWLVIHASNIYPFSRMDTYKLEKEGKRGILRAVLNANKAGFRGYDGTSFRNPSANTPKLTNCASLNLDVFLPVALCHHLPFFDRWSLGKHLC
jgi:hypothetical protein